MDIGFIVSDGRGAAIAARLLAAGHQLHALAGFSVPDGPGLIRHRDARSLAVASAAVLLLLPDAADVDDALFAENGLAAGLAPGTPVIDLSSLPPDRAAANAGRLATAGCALLDAPLSGGLAAALAGELTVDLGGEAGTCAWAEPLLALFVARVTRTSGPEGGPGSGQRARLVRALGVRPDPCGNRPLDGDPDGLRHVLHLLTGPGDTVGTGNASAFRH